MPAIKIILCFFIANIFIALIGRFSPPHLLKAEFVGLGLLGIIIIVNYYQVKTVSINPKIPIKGMFLTVPTTTLAILIFMVGYIFLLKHLAVEDVKYLAEYKKAGLPVWIAFIAIAAWPAFFEEIAFRGVIYQSLLSIGSPKEAIILQALLFSVVHLSPAIFISHFLIGLALGWLATYHKSLIPSMLVHFFYNSSILLFEYFKLL
ncbi:CPBP family intramembrane metalloprotease [Myxococcota bacterium]|nr:CPBP family intramembrane metalloprotease [Myxococcota bacterium]MBU1383113.1 CPBP family intramembrane metalloprotease [Myxococcota bacterium]MBU1499064.1 CPBP family intramembrane metalloprotease [Myxococcota bacterium]